MLSFYLCELFLRRCLYADHVVANGRIIGKYEEERIWERNCRGLTEVLSWNLPDETEENRETFVRTADVPAEIRTNHLSNRSRTLSIIYI
jgi:hypothetical protein